MPDRSTQPSPAPLRTAVLATGALVAFAGNSLLCRMALGAGMIDAAGFTGIRLLSGALAMALVLKLSAPTMPAPRRGSWLSAAALFCYAAAFSFAYLTLGTGTGALILFGAVQLTMLGAALLAGERLRWRELVGACLAFGGLAYLVFPGVSAPSLTGSLLMAGAGIAWGVYSLRGRGARQPLAETARNFARALPCAALLVLAFGSSSHLSATGILLAVLSGALASGGGYAVWYAALQGMTAARAAIVQLAVPLLAAFGGVVLLDEVMTLRLVVAAAAILSGIGLAVAGRRRRAMPLMDSKYL